MAKFAAWRLERGVSLGVLEQLMGSKTVFGTLSTQVILRTFNVAGVVLVLLWSPVTPWGPIYIAHDPASVHNTRIEFSTYLL